MALLEQAAIAAANDAATAKSISDLSKDPFTGLSPGELAGGPQSQAQADKDAVTSASSPTATGGKANSPSTGGTAPTPVSTDPGIASLGIVPDKDQAIAIGFQNAERDREDAAKESAILGSTTPTPTPTVIAGGIYVDAKNAAAAAAMANAAASLAAAEAPSFTPDTAPSAPAPDAGPSSGSESGSGYGEGLGADYGKANGGMVGHYAQGGLGSLGGYSDGGRLLRGPGDGVSDSIPASIGDRQPARLANNEFVIPARIVSEIGNGSTDAGAKRLYQMMDRIQNARKKSMGKGKIAVDSKAYLHLPA